MNARLAVIALGLSSLLVVSHADALPPRTAPQAAVVCSLAGEWSGIATDDAGTRWTFPMHVRQSGTTIDATIEWTASNGNGGTETVRGAIDCATRRLELHTVTVTGELASGYYHATLGADFRMFSGNWDGPGAIPGRFTATRR